VTDRPDVLLLFTDMQRADTIHALGNDVIKTPHLDRLVREGTSFTNCHTPSPVCVPARCCMHYGLYAQRTGVFDNRPMMDDNGRSLPAVLGANGYRTRAVGKCHFTPDKHALRGFDSRRTQEECTSDPEDDDYVAWLEANGYDYYEANGARGEMYYIPQVSCLPAEAHPTQWVGNESVRFIQERATVEEPWFLFSSYIHPHPPFAPPKPWHKLYRTNEVPLPFVPTESEGLLTWVNRAQNRYKWRDRGIDQNLVRTIKAYCYATISFVDYQVGRILAALEATGRLDNTLILFASDHGEYLGDYNCFGKRSMHDAASRVPMIVRMPARFEAGVECDAATSLVDVMPTILGAAGFGREGLDLDGLDLAAVSRGEHADRTVYSQFGSHQQGIYMAVNRKWKYFYSAGDDREFLFDRVDDPQESVNLAGGETSRTSQAEMKQDLLEYLQSVNASEAFLESETGLEWKKYDHIDQTYLRDPDAGFLFQDYPSYELDAPEYLGRGDSE